MKQHFHVGIAATGMVLPKKCYTNDDIISLIKEKTVGREDVPELNSAWIEENIWIKSRYFFSEDETMCDVSVQAVEQALKTAGWDPMELDFVILSSSSGYADTYSIPSLAGRIQEQLNAFNAFAYDTSAACSGWVYAMTQGVAMIESGIANKGVVICTEKQKQGMDFSNHRSSILIGDVATATLLERQETAKVSSVHLRANNEKKLSSIIRLPFMETENGALRIGYFALDGRTVFKEGVATMIALTQQTLASNGLQVDDIDWFIYHQANGAMLRMVGRKVGMDDQRNLMNIQKLANTTAGTIPSVLHMHIDDGTIKRGDKICCIAFGGGLTSGSIVFEY
jgi:3-oxoacyl-[acyl-carrier-protein] synthase III